MELEIYWSVTNACEGGTVQSDATGVWNGPSCGYPGNNMKFRQVCLRFRVSKTLDYVTFSSLFINP